MYFDTRKDMVQSLVKPNGVKDLEAAYSKVKSGGWIMGHDYEMNMSKAHTVYDCSGLKKAVDEFCTKYNLSIQYLGMDGCVSYAIKK